MNSDKPYMQPYHRPNQSFTCGRDDRECLCGTGPTGDGTCRDPKNPCKPRLALRARRRVFVVACFALVLSYVLVGLWKPVRDRFTSPGPLNSVHARLTNGSPHVAPSDGAHADALANAQSCVHCHDAAGKSPLDWLASVFDCRWSAADSSHATGQSEKCLKCHEAQLGSSWAMFAHNVDPAALAKHTEAQLAATQSPSSATSLEDMLSLVSLPSKSGTPAPANSTQLACATCHHEHQGANIDIKAMTDRQCQSCHQNECRSFATDHPEFTRWPSYSERPHIAFTHVAHEAKHFPSKNQTFDCNRCHVDDAERNTKLLAGFQQACASCHEGEIKVAAAEGMTALSLPTLDTETLRRERLAIPENWPQAARGDFDGKLPDLMVFLLAADKKAIVSLEKFAPHFDFSKVDMRRPDDLKHAATVANAIAALMHELKSDARGTVRRRIETLRDRPMLDAELDRFMTRLPQELLTETIEKWFADKARGVGNTATPESELFHFVWQPKPVIQSEWLRANPLKGTVTKSTGGSPTKPGSQPAAKPATPANQSKPAPGPARAIAVAANPNGELLRENPLAKPSGAKPASTPRPETPAPANHAPAVVETEPEVAASEPESSSGAEATPATQPDKSAVAASEPVGPSPYAVNGGWFANHETLSIKYRPEGHADPVLVAWLELAAELTHRRDAWATSVKRLVRGSAAQACIRCHSGADPESGGQSMRWHAETRDTHVRPFTKFSHRPHTLSNDQQNCRECHALNRDLLTTVSQSNLDDRSPLAGSITAAPARCDFMPLGKANCAQCHNATGASQSCTQCHNYHVGAKVGDNW